MRILAVSPYYEPDGGGLERYAHAILARLAAQGHHVEACAYAADVSGPRHLVTHTEHRDGVQVHRIQTHRRVGNTPLHTGFGRWFDDRITRVRPDVVLVHTPVPLPALTAARIARRRGIPVVTTYHAGRLRGSGPILAIAAGILRYAVEPRMLAASAGLIAVSPYVRDHALAKHRDRTQVISPGVESTRFSPGRKVEPEFLFVGPLDSRYRWKGVDVLLAAFARLRRSHPEARLRLVGDGDRRRQLQRVAGRIGGIDITERLSDARLAAAYARAAALVLPSTTDAEAFGMVLAEANACGRPVIGSDTGGIPDFIRHGDNGLLVPAGDARALSDAMAQVLDDPAGADAMGRHGRGRVVQDHDWDALTVATEEVLKAAVARFHAKPDRRASGPVRLCGPEGAGTTRSL